MKPLISNALLTFSSAFLLTLSFPGYDLWALAWAGIIPLFYIIMRNKRKQSFLWSWFSGTIFYILTIYWITETMVQFGNMPVWMSVMVLLLLSTYLGLYTGLFGYFIKLISDYTSIPLIITAPFLWVSLEFLKGHLITGFPWASLGYSQYKFIHVIQISDITGVYGVSFLLVAVNALFYEILFVRKEQGSGRHPSIIQTVSIISIVILTLCYGYYKTSIYSNSGNNGIKVAVIQGNIPQNLKWDRGFQRRTIDIYKRLTTVADGYHPDLVIWPETATPFFFQESSQYRDEIFDLVSGGNIHLLLGSPAYELSNSDQKMLNSAYLISPYRETVARYDKIHLVPFGEYVPLSKILFFVEKMAVGIGDFSPGSGYTVMNHPKGDFGVVICYEVIFPELVRKFVLNGAGFMATITNDAWFGRTSAPYQHFSMTVFRSIENRVWFARAANTGISGFISPKGEILHASPIFEEAWLIQDIQPATTKTFYTYYGDLFAWFAVIVTCLSLLRTVLKVYYQ